MQMRGKRIQYTSNTNNNGGAEINKHKTLIKRSYWKGDSDSVDEVCTGTKP